MCCRGFNNPAPPLHRNVGHSGFASSKQWGQVTYSVANLPSPSCSSAVDVPSPMCSRPDTSTAPCSQTGINHSFNSILSPFGTIDFFFFGGGWGGGGGGGARGNCNNFSKISANRSTASGPTLFGRCVHGVMCPWSDVSARCQPDDHTSTCSGPICTKFAGNMAAAYNIIQRKREENILSPTLWELLLRDVTAATFLPSTNRHVPRIRVFHLNQPTSFRA